MTPVTYAYPINLSQVMDSAFLTALAEQVPVTSEVSIAVIYTQQRSCRVARMLCARTAPTRVGRCPPDPTPAGTPRGAATLCSPPRPRGAVSICLLCILHRIHKATHGIHQHSIETVPPMFTENKRCPSRTQQPAHGKHLAQACSKDSVNLTLCGIGWFFLQMWPTNLVLADFCEPQNKRR